MRKQSESRCQSKDEMHSQRYRYVYLQANLLHHSGLRAGFVQVGFENPPTLCVRGENEKTIDRVGQTSLSTLIADENHLCSPGASAKHMGTCLWIVCTVTEVPTKPESISEVCARRIVMMTPNSVIPQYVRPLASRPGEVVF